jgi:ribosomal-protein-alanine N-acetyltransferase
MTRPEIVAAEAVWAEALALLHARTMKPAWDAAAIRRLLTAPAARAFVATGAASAEPAGFVLAFRAADEAELLMLAVAPEQRRQGIARALVAHLLDELSSEGVTRLFLEVAADNWPAISLYHRTGFVETGRRRDYYTALGQAPIDALLLARVVVARGPASV